MSFISCTSDCRHQEDGCCGLTAVPIADMTTAGTSGDCVYYVRRYTKRDRAASGTSARNSD